MKISFLRSFFDLSIVGTLVCYSVRVHAQLIKDGLAGHWTFNKKDTT